MAGPDSDLPFDDILNPDPQSTNNNDAMLKEIDIFGETPGDESGEGFDPSFPSIEEYDKKKRIKILFLTSLPFLLQPLSTTMIVPSFNDIQVDLETSYTWVVLTVAGYNLMAGILPMFYGPVSDQYGRKLIWYLTLPAFILFAALSGFSVNIWMLIVFRSLMGACTCASAIVGAGIIMDIFPTEGQGKALGAQQFPLLLAPIVGSPLGGLLNQWFGWRSVNFFLAIFAIPIAIIVFMLIPETLVKKDKISPSQVAKAMNPWNTIKLLFRPIIGFVALGRAVGFASMILMTTLTPKILETFHGMSSGQIGFWNLAFSFGAIVGTILGGVAVDQSLKRFGPGGRLLSANISTVILALGLVGFGWTIQWNSWVGLIFSTMIGFGVCANRPGFLTYAIRELPSKSSAVTGSTMMLSMVLSLPLSLLGPSMATWIGVPALFSLGGALVVLFIIPTLIIMGLNIQRDYNQEDSS